jgi:NADH dehydrogenase FAD-containing subunit
MPFKNLSSTEETKKSLHDWAERISSAKSIVVAGAGATGIELAGELGQEYASTGKKEITLVCDQDLPLADKFRRDVRETAKKELENLKVKVITNAKVAASAPSSTTLTLTQTTPSDGTKTTTLQADLLIPTYGVTPNTSFLPPSMLDARGFVKQTSYLRAEGHDAIFVVGDAGNLQTPQGVHADQQVVHVVKLIEARLLARDQDQGQGQAAAAPAAPEYKPDGKILFAATLGRNRGTGQFGGWKLWSWLVWFMKGRHLGTNHAVDFVKGERTAMQKDW